MFFLFNHTQCPHAPPPPPPSPPPPPPFRPRPAPPPASPRGGGGGQETKRTVKGSLLNWGHSKQRELKTSSFHFLIVVPNEREYSLFSQSKETLQKFPSATCSCIVELRKASRIFNQIWIFCGFSLYYLLSPEAKCMENEAVGEERSKKCAMSGGAQRRDLSAHGPKKTHTRFHLYVLFYRTSPSSFDPVSLFPFNPTSPSHFSISSSFNPPPLFLLLIPSLSPLLSPSLPPCL